MNKVYVVTRGDYSDYGIEAIFSTTELAEKYAGMIDNDYESTRVEEHELDPEKEIITRGYGYWRVHMMRDGKVTISTVSQEKPKGFDSTLAEVLKATFVKSGEWYLNCKMTARDRDHAVKIANERRTAILAAHQWPDDPPTEE